MDLGEDYSVTSDFDWSDFDTDYTTDSYTTTGEDTTFNFDADDFDGGAVATVLAVIASMLAIIGIVALAMYIWNGITTMKIFKKAGHKNPWAGWVPIYNVWVMAEVGGYPGWLSLISCFGSVVPVVGGIAALVVSILILNKLAQAFGKGAGFTVGLVLLYPIFIGILAFGSAEYVGVSSTGEAVAANPQPMPEAPKEDNQNM